MPWGNLHKFIGIVMAVHFKVYTYVLCIWTLRQWWRSNTPHKPYFSNNYKKTQLLYQFQNYGLVLVTFFENYKLD